MKIKVLSIQPDFKNEGGVGTVVFSLANEFKKQDIIENKIIILKSYDGYILKKIKKITGKALNLKRDIKTDDSVKVVYFKDTIFNRIVNKYIYQNWNVKIVAKQINKNIEIKTFDIIHGHLYTPNGHVANLLAKKHSKKSIVTFHGSDTIDINNSDTNLINSFDKVTFVSCFLENVVKNKIDLIVPYKIINNGINSDFFHLKNKEPNRNVIAYCGRLHSIKGVQHLKKIFSELFRLMPTLEFHIYGDGIERENLQEFFIKNNIPVKFFGNLGTEKLAEKFQQVRILIMPSEREGFPCIVQEAKACGTYVIAANVGGIPEAIGNIGSLINRDDNFEFQMIEEAMRIWQQTTFSVEDISRDNIYSWKQISKQYEEIYKELVSGN